MKVEAVEAYPVRLKMEERLVGGAFAYGDYQTVAVRTVCDGVAGWGEAMTRSDPRVNALLVEHLGGVIRGKEFGTSHDAWEHMWRTLRIRGHTRGPPVEALSGIEMALLDCQGKLSRRGVARLFSDRPATKLRAIAGSLFESRGSLAEQVEKAKGAGLDGAKVKIGFGPDKDLAALKQVRKLWPDGVLVADANGAYDARAARAACAAFRVVDLAWFEEPVLSDDWSGYASLRGSGVRIGGGESWFVSDFDGPVDEGLVQVLEPSVSRCGGVAVEVTAARKAQKRGIAFSPMTGMNSGISLAASLHAGGAVEAEVVEYNPFPNPLQTELVVGLPEPKGGYVQVPKGHGLGVEVDMDFVRKHEA